jgi:polyribonucleotide nucleotidyltransferase
MKLDIHQKTIDLGDGKVIHIETGKLAKQAHGSVVVRMGDTMLLATVVADEEAGENVDFLPLTVDYREKYASTGKFPGGFFKREARPSDNEVLTMRLVDRALRPMFPDDFHANTQVQIQLMSSDGIDMPDALCGLAASAAIAVSDIPFNGPISEVRVARINGSMVINPTIVELESADIDMMVAGSADSIIMVEGEMSEVSEAEMVEAIQAAHSAIKVHCQVQSELAAAVKKSEPKRTYQHERHDLDLKKSIHDNMYQAFYDLAKANVDKAERKARFKEIKSAFVDQMDSAEAADKSYMIGQYVKSAQKSAIRNLLLDEGIRLDGRSTTDIRPIWAEVGYLPTTHGSAIFTRGETQSLTTLTLGTKMDEQRVDSPLLEKTEKFLLHYNFPPFSTGEARPLRGVSRREVGHGNLALRALKPVLPSVEDCPYTIRLVSEILESNGSSSMATVCAGCLALMDGGVQIKAPVSGIAMGLVTDPESGKYRILSDILGDEDHLGDMDFKVTGTAAGITACQMDIKVKGLSMEVLTEALNQAKEGRLHILDKIVETMAQPNADYKPHAPRIVAFEIPTDTIGAVIGPGGKIIQEIQASTEATISIDEVDGKGYVQISATNKASIDAAVSRVRNICFPPTIEIGETYEGKIKTVVAYGAFVEILPGQDGLLHISEYGWERVENASDVFNEGELIKFKVTGRDPKTGKVKLSRKALLPRPERNDA